jgi:hypothetical protein
LAIKVLQQPAAFDPFSVEFAGPGYNDRSEFWAKMKIKFGTK